MRLAVHDGNTPKQALACDDHAPITSAMFPSSAD